MNWVNMSEESLPLENTQNKTIHLNYPRITLGGLLHHSAEKFPLKKCIAHKSFGYNFRQVDLITNRVANGLLALGFKKGDRIGILLPNIPQFVFCFFGIVKMGGIVVAINPQYQLREIKEQVHTAGISGLFILTGRLDLVSELKQATSIRKFISTKPDDSFSLTDVSTQLRSNCAESKLPLPEVIDLQNLFSLQPNHQIQEMNVITYDDPAIFQFSGGTTGIPKAAVGLHRNVVANVLQFRAWLHTVQDEINPFLVAIPLFHVYGMVLGMILAVLMGCPMILIENPGDISGIFKGIKKYKPTIFPSVPSIYYAMLNSPELSEYSQYLKYLKVCISGSASLNHKVKRDFEDLIGGTLIEGYGLSEAPTATHCNPVSGQNKVGSIGLPLPDVVCKLVSLEDGRHEVSDGKLGELIIQGPQIMKEYYNNLKETNETLRNGWLYTGDIAWKDSDGYYFIKGRKKDLIKVGGLQVWPQEVEDVIASILNVKETCAAGIPDDYLGEVVYAWIVVEPGSSLTAQDILVHCRSNLARHKVPNEVIFLEKLPRSTVGKVLRRELIRSIIKK